MRISQAILTTIICCAAGACSGTTDITSAASVPDSIELYFARGSLFKAPEFESYKLVGQKLYTECGTLSGGRHAVADRSLLSLTAEEIGRVRESASTVSSQLSASRGALDEPGDGRGFADPGIFEANVLANSTPITIRTSFDSVANGEGASERRLRTLAQTVREAALSARTRTASLSPLPCGNSAFFGLR